MLRLNRSRRIIAFAGLVLCSVHAAATPSGLNNTTTADTMTAGRAAFQTFGIFGTFFGRTEPNYFMGVKVGFNPFSAFDLELGVDSHVAPSFSGPVLFQAKASKQFIDGGPKAAVGVANGTIGALDRRAAGEPIAYLSLTQPIGDARVHTGYQLQQANNAFFAGADYTFDVASRPLTVRADAVQMFGQTDWWIAPGVMYQVNDLVVLESWATYTTKTASWFYLLKLNIII